jgi:hypothetical protein
MVLLEVKVASAQRFLAASEIGPKRLPHQETLDLEVLQFPLR